MRSDHPTDNEIPGLRQLWQEAFGDTDAFLDSFFQTAFSPRRCLCLRDGDTVAAALYWFDCALADRKIAYLYAVATAQAHRGRGLCKALMGQALALLCQQGYSGALLSPAEEGLFSMYEKMGFREVLTIREFPALAGGVPAALTSIAPEEYARLRREALPAGGLVQEGENLAFLARNAAFYRGENCLFAAAKEDGHLFCMEYFGPDSLAPEIVAALGAQTGTFRTPGIEKPFALYASLDGKPAPSYFSLAFD